MARIAASDRAAGEKPRRAAVAPRPASRRRAADAAGPANGSRVEAVIALIKEGVRVGRFAPGQRLVESDLQKIVGTSRGPIREAMRRLAAEGVLDMQHYKGARVRQLSRAEIVGIYQVREALEGLACRLAAQNIGRPGNRAKLRDIDNAFDHTFDGSPRDYLRYNEQYHRLIVAMAENPHLERLVGQLQLPSFLLLVHVLVDRISSERARDDHRGVTRAILAGDGAAAEAAMQTHLRRTCAFILERAGALLG